MTISVDDLMKVFDAAFEARGAANERSGARNFVADCNRDAVIAVVTALRDEMASISGWNEINEILAERGDEAAGGSDRKDEREDNGCITPAGPKPAAAPDATCEYNDASIDPLGYAWMRAGCGVGNVHERDVLMQPNQQKLCMFCARPIKFGRALG